MRRAAGHVQKINTGSSRIHHIHERGELSDADGTGHSTLKGRSVDAR